MFDTLVLIAFWSVFSVLSLGALVFLAGTLMASDQLTTARHHVDDGSEDPGSVSYRLYALAMRSAALSTATWIAFMPLIVGGVAAFAGKTLGASFLALVLAGASFIVADVLRTRHERIERAFTELAGPIRDIYLKVLDRSAQLR